MSTHKPIRRVIKSGSIAYPDFCLDCKTYLSIPNPAFGEKDTEGVVDERKFLCKCDEEENNDFDEEQYAWKGYTFA